MVLCGSVLTGGSNGLLPASCSNFLDFTESMLLPYGKLGQVPSGGIEIPYYCSVAAALDYNFLGQGLQKGICAFFGGLGMGVFCIAIECTHFDPLVTYVYGTRLDACSGPLVC